MQTKGSSGNHCSAARQAVESAAIALFAYKGFDAATTREICAKAGVTKPVLYYYFGCKERLYTDLILRSFNELREQLVEASRRGETTREKLVEMVAACFQNTRSSPDRSRLIFHMMFAPCTYHLNIDFSERWKPVAKTVQRVLEEGAAEGEIRGNAEALTAALLGIQTYYIMDFLVSGKTKLDRALAARVVGLLWHGIEPPVAARRIGSPKRRLGRSVKKNSGGSMASRAH